MAEQKLKTVHVGKNDTKIKMDVNNIFYITKGEELLSMRDNIMDAITDLKEAENTGVYEITVDELDCFIYDKHRKAVKIYGVTLYRVVEGNQKYYEIRINGEKVMHYYSSIEVRAFLDGLLA